MKIDPIQERQSRSRSCTLVKRKIVLLYGFLIQKIVCEVGSVINSLLVYKIWNLLKDKLKGKMVALFCYLLFDTDHLYSTMKHILSWQAWSLPGWLRPHPQDMSAHWMVWWGWEWCKWYAMIWCSWSANLNPNERLRTEVFREYIGSKHSLKAHFSLSQYLGETVAFFL